MDTLPYLRRKDQNKNPQEQAHIFGFAERLEAESRFAKEVERSRKNVVDFKNKKRSYAEKSYISYQMDYESWSSFDEVFAY